MKKKREKNWAPDLSDADFASGAASATEYTGLIPARPATNAELRSFYAILEPEPRKRTGE